MSGEEPDELAITRFHQLALPDGYIYKIDFNENDVIVKVKDITSKEDTEVWLKNLEHSSKVTWRVLKTRSCSGSKVIYRKDYKCHHNTDRRGHGNLRKSKHTGCPALLKIIIKRYKEDPKAKNTVDKDFACICVFSNDHNHSLNSAEILRQRPLGLETKLKLLELFQRGFSASMAYNTLKANFMLEHNEAFDQIENDGALLPTPAVVYHLFKKEFKGRYKNKSAQEVSGDIKNLLESYNETTDGRAALEYTPDGSIIVAICSPIMQRAIRHIPKVNEFIFVDSLGNLDRKNHRVYFFVSPSSAGGIPIGCIITDCEKQENFQKGCLLLRKCFPLDSNLRNNGPRVLMTDGDLKEHEVLSEIWPESIYLLCQFHILRSLWAWVCEPQHEISKKHRLELYFTMRDMMYALDEANMLTKKCFLLNHPVAIKNKKFVEYFEKLWLYRTLWGNAYQTELSIHNNIAHNYMKALFRVFKKQIFQKIKILDFSNIITFFLVKYDSYLKDWLLDFSSERYTKTALTKIIPNAKIKDTYNIAYDDNKQVFMVNNCMVDTENYFCTCVEGCTGQLCKHLVAVTINTNANNSFYLCSRESKRKIYYVVTGEAVNEHGDSSAFNPCSDSESDAQEQHSGDINGNKSIVESTFDMISIEHEEEIEEHCTIMKDNEQNEVSVMLYKFQEFIKIISQKVNSGLINNPAVYVPTVKKMINNYEQFCHSETDFLSAMLQFGKSDIDNRTVSHMYVNRFESKVGVQPISIGKRKSLSTKKRKREDDQLDDNLN